MENQVTLGVDIGGSHVTSALVNLNTHQIVAGSMFNVKVNNKASKAEILKQWSIPINNTLQQISAQTNVNIGFAMPGPFNYKKGISLIKGNDKYENLYNVSIANELPNFINASTIHMRFINDATAFGIGASLENTHANKKIIACTLGTGFGSSFLKDNIPQIHDVHVPDGGCFWYKPFKDGIADDYFSTRWCVKRYFEITGLKVIGVKEIAEANTADSQQVFNEFGSNMADFLLPFLKDFNPNLLILGGNISLAHAFFLPTLKQQLNLAGIDIDIDIASFVETSAILGAAKLFNPDFWKHIAPILPEN